MKNLSLFGLVFAVLLLVSVHPSHTRADSFPPDAPICAIGTPGTTFSFTETGDPPLYNTPVSGAQLSFWDGSTWQVSTNPDITGRNWTASHAWPAPGVYAVRGFGPTSITHGTGCESGPCSGTGGPSGGTENGPNGSGSGNPAFCRVIVTSALADLTAGSVSPASATAAAPVTYSATVSNIGTATSDSFPTRFQVQESGDSFVSAYVGGLAPNASAPASASYTFPSAGTYHLRACANQNAAGTNIVSESNYGNNCGPWTAITVAASVPPVAANLTAGGISPTSATVSANTSFTSTINNTGGVSTGASFSVLFQKANDASGSGASDMGAQTTPALGAGSSRNVSYIYMPVLTGTFYMRACADKSSAGNTGVIPESNESDNCGPWTAISVSSGPTLSCTVTPTTVATPPGTVQYTASGASAPITWNDGASGSYGTAVIANRTISTAGSYTMTVSKAGFGNGVCPVVTGGAGAPPTYCSTGSPSLAITAMPARVNKGDTVAVSWSASNVLGSSPSCTITRSDSGTPIHTEAAGAPPTCSIPNGNSQQVVTTQTIFTITCGTASASALVNVVPNVIED